MPTKELGVSQYSVQQRAHFVDEALAARTEMLESGEGYDADNVRLYLRKRVVDTNISKPPIRSWRTSTAFCRG